MTESNRIQRPDLYTPMAAMIDAVDAYSTQAALTSAHDIRTQLGPLLFTEWYRTVRFAVCPGAGSSTSAVRLAEGRSCLFITKGRHHYLRRTILETSGPRGYQSNTVALVDSAKFDGSNISQELLIFDHDLLTESDIKRVLSAVVTKAYSPLVLIIGHGERTHSGPGLPS